MSNSQMVAVLEQIAGYVSLRGEDGECRMEFPFRAEIEEVVSEALWKLRADEEAEFAYMIARYEDAQDARADAISAGWGHD